MRPRFATGAVFILFAAVSAWLQWVPAFLDVDSFYHAKMADLLLHGTLVRAMPWLPQTTLATHFADHHFLFHVFLLPFIAATDSLHGAVLATVVLTGLVGATFENFLNRSNVPHPWVFALVMLLAPAFVLRICLARAVGFSVVFVFLGLTLMIHDRGKWLFVLGFLFVWAYGGWPLLPLIAVTQLLLRIGSEVLKPKQERASYLSLLSSGREIRNLAYVASGCGLGLLINPFFPNNLWFYWEQTVQIALVNYSNLIAVGGEWQRTTFLQAVPGTWGVWALLGGVTLLALVRGLETTPEGRTERSTPKTAHAILLSVLASAFLLLTLKSQRNVEYFVPFAVAALGVWAAKLGLKEREAALAKKVQVVTRIAAFSVVSGVLISLGIISLLPLRKEFIGGSPWTRYSKVAAWLTQHTPPGSMLVYGGWGEFSLLFFYGAHNSYIVGLDPTFLYRRNPKLYEAWAGLGSGESRRGIARELKEQFKARFILVDKHYLRMCEVLSEARGMTLAYEDQEAKVYQLSEPLPTKPRQ